MSKENLSKFIDAVVNSDNDKLASLIKPVIEAKAREIVAKIRGPKLMEFFGGPLNMENDGTVTLHNKKVGKVFSDTDPNSDGPAFVYKSLDGSVNQGFEDIETLSTFLHKIYQVE